MKLASLESIVRYESDTNYVQYNQDLVAQFFRSKFVLKCGCALFIETEVVVSFFCI
jgi:hypothetical protein